MSLTHVKIDSGSQSSSATATTASVTLTTGKFYFALIFNETNPGSTRNHATIAGWTEVPSNGYVSSAADRDTLSLTVLTIDGTGATATLTIDFAAQSQSFFNWQIIEIAGQSATPLVQTTKATGSSGNPAATLAAFADAVNNSAFAVIAHFTQTITPEVGWTLISADTGDLGFISAFKIGQDTSPSGTVVGGDDWIMFAAEIAAAGGGGGISEDDLKGFLAPQWADPFAAMVFL